MIISLSSDDSFPGAGFYDGKANGKANGMRDFLSLFVFIVV